MTPKIYITRKLPDPIVDKLKNAFEVRMWEKEEEPVPREILEKEIQEVEGLYCLLTESIDKDLLHLAHRLKIVSNMAVGYNNIDLAAATEKGIMVTNTPGVLTETSADLTFALLMATARRVVEASDYLRAGDWKTWSPMQLTGQDIYGAVLGILGLGRIGEAVAKRARGFDMNILYHNRSRKPEAEGQLGLKYVSKEALLRESDFVCVLTPYTPETGNYIGAKELSLMKPNAILINTARGGIVNEEALYHALKRGQIWGAGIDVFEEEPVRTDHPLLSLPNVVALPHIGSASNNTRLKMALLAAENLLQGLQGNTPKNLVN
ncbi:D-glycerate dehydrogenase [Bacillus sp. EB106-08-02-XG196]|jgi:glyoxylate reductase|uniref:2-hydroxyacid dehydrogenase n=1 Tax=Bacillus sp. EB106-08-02-XG196 TaxID=2737049 RepID=UPI0015C4C8A1|nr:D-glycerate dehydrogenase [Bacillus sp. EB106-08-02-XG196]NWQ39569.1 D-glycerate dehydrogenase [Bacillus sp. EB106-08-02-XG196]